MYTERPTELCLLLLLLALGCVPQTLADSDQVGPVDGVLGDGDESALIPQEELDLYRPYFPAAEQGRRFELSPDALPSEDIENGNLHGVVLQDDQGEVLGYARTVFTPVGCEAGVCAAVRFTLVFDADFWPFDVFHVPGMAYDFKKYWQDEYLTFDTQDLSLLIDLVRSPPDLLLAAPTQADLVDGTNGSAPTRPEFQAYVVRGAVFTCYQVVQYAVDTGTLLAAMAGGGAAP
jgi:hypothetical protein